MNENTLPTAAQAIGEHAFHRNLHQAQTRSAFAAYVLWFFLGSVGAHLMYTRRWVMLTTHYLLLVLTGVGIGMVFHNDDIHGLAVGFAALWGAFLPFSTFSFLSMCILFAQVNYCNEDSAFRLAGQKPKLTRVTERLVIIISVGAFAIFATLMSGFPGSSHIRFRSHDEQSTTPDTTARPAVPQANPESANSAPAANVEQDSTQPQANAAEASSQMATGADAAQAQEQQPLVQVQSTEPPAAQQTDAATDFNTNPNQVYGTSFDCGQSHSQNEYLICHTPALASADVKLANAVAAAKSAINPTDLDALKERLRGQWNFREKHCNDVACLNTWYTYQANTMALIAQTGNVAARVDTAQN
ncbi:hypothetical protein [Paraburkholderia sp. CI3]|uniref:hypothetical protein n=1 Tax=Paraburkholderia sp. CI3 TaxID=2991060 RepID=UPI003D1D431C